MNIKEIMAIDERYEVWRNQRIGKLITHNGIDEEHVIVWKIIEYINKQTNKQRKSMNRITAMQPDEQYEIWKYEKLPNVHEKSK